MRFTSHPTLTTGVILGSALALSAVHAGTAQAACADLPTHAELQTELNAVVDGGGNAGLGNEMWGTIVDRDGVVCAVAFSGEFLGDQWPGSRVISAQKANTANAFSLEGEYPNVGGVGRALASGNLYGLVQPGGSLFGLQHSNPVDTAVAYGDDPGDHKGADAEDYGSPTDPMVGQMIGGVNVFGGGLALYDEEGFLLGGLGVSGDTSCTDHIIAWKVRDALGFDNIPGGVGDGFTNDNLILADPGPVEPNTFQHPICGFGEEDVIDDLATNFPIGPSP